MTSHAETRKQAILAALDRFVSQRPGLDPRDYGATYGAYQSEARAIARDKREALILIAEVADCEGITGQDIERAAHHAFSGRLTLRCTQDEPTPAYAVDYCTGQYWPTEYRKAVCAVLASALWQQMRERAAADDECALPPMGDRLRKHFAKRLGRGMASRWFN